MAFAVIGVYFVEFDTSVFCLVLALSGSLILDRGFDPSGSHQLPIAGSVRDQCLCDTPQLVYFLEIIYSFGGSRILDCDW